MQSPKWFQAFEKRNNTKFDKIESHLDKQDEFNRFVLGVFKKNNLKE
ncbi:MAG: hypothetical protein LBP70_00855 [Mycoplasmataceae bacterium]|nr:hypothetical protein [Mycoplasmataceae bacterium]